MPRMRSRVPISILACTFGVGLAGQAWGQVVAVKADDVRVGYQPLPVNSASGSPENGVQVGDGLLLHAGVGAEAGYDSNVFYSDTDPQGSAIIRVVPFAELTNKTRTGALPEGAAFDIGTSLTYREYLSNDALIRDQRAFMPSAYGNLEVSGRQAVSFGVSDSFNRTEDPPYLRSGTLDPFIRDTNVGLAQIRVAPGGGRLAGALRYTNIIDYFETNIIKGASSMSQALSLDVSWKWLPKTALFVQVTQGYVSYFNTVPGDTKSPSYPLHAMAGLRGLITPKLSVNLAVGYTNGFYSNVPGPVGFRGNFSAGADATYRPTLMTTFIVGYRHDFQNAILGDFYYLDSAYLNVGQAIAGRVGFGLSARYESRSFQGVPLADGTKISRHDNYLEAGANLDYRIRAWTYAGIAYTVMSNSSPYEPTAPDDPGRVNYVKHLVFARLGLSY
jgi:hypothetical protein